MSTLTLRAFLCVLTLLCSAMASSAVGQDSDVQVVEMTQEEGSTLVGLGFGTCQWLHPLDTPKETLLAQPEYASEAPVYYAAVYGDSEDNVFTFVIDESEGTGKGYDTLYLDADNDNRIDAQSERIMFKMSTTIHAEPVRLKIEISSGGRKAPYWVDFTAFPYTDQKNPIEKIHANLRNASYYTGEAMFQGTRCKIAIADLNSNGLFNDPESEGIWKGDRFFVDLDNDGSFMDDRGDDGNNGFPYGRYTKIEDRWYTIVASADGGTVTISEAVPAFGQVEAPGIFKTAYLQSENQACHLSFSNGVATALTGTYRVRSFVLSAPDASTPALIWRALASVPVEARRDITILEGETASLEHYGPPLSIKPTIARSKEEGQLDIGVEIVGVGGEIYSWPRGNPRADSATVAVRDDAGKSLVSATLEYG